MLRIAIPNKGSLSETASAMLAEAGYNGRRDSRTLVQADPKNDVEFFYLRPRDIATYVGSGALDVGITGRDLLLDSASAATEIAELNFADSTFRFASPVGSEISEIEHLEGKRVATSYPVLVGNFLAERGINATTVKLDGAVESAVQLGVADAVADVVSTGATLRAAGLSIFGPVILDSTALIIGGPTEHPGIERLLRRLRGVLVARKYVIMDYDLPVAKLEAAVEIAGGIESPTVSPLRNEGWVAVRVMVPSADANEIMDKLYDLGARAILVTAIHAARL
ncbi:ATP phosphoribosyltransferase [Leucobacter sp. cx-328]|uniref:ATP phosphoribosyltransferase n=1 Tax=unclassified Leucobacter TaxID=2621730 RepID=UPI00165DE459|nr:MULTISPECIES: ATP phosphoribosyltransferase [unclassified Leucobacter]MBC9944884.1 ATP phosphoribosyltransferase [Leucobacter sp. cx-328]MBC9954795.1 ATP phosphoribosyltransferase [Leucobacter sp. cx-42]